MRKISRNLFCTVLLAVLSNSVSADHTQVNDMECVREAGVITTTWTVTDPRRKFGGDLQIEADFIAQCGKDSKTGTAKVGFYLNQDDEGMFVYSCVTNKNEDMQCKAKSANLDGVIAAAVTASAEALCDNLQQPILNTTHGEIATWVSVKHLQRGAKEIIQCLDLEFQEHPEDTPTQ